MGFAANARLFRRHLVRLWLRDEENAWDTPEPLTEVWNRVYGGVTAEKSVFPLEPFIRSASKGEDKANEEPTAVVA